MSSTYATVIVSTADRATAHADLEDDNLFTIALSADGSDPATHYAASGWFLNGQLDFIANEAAWSKTMRFGNDLSAHLGAEGLKQVIDVAELIN